MKKKILALLFSFVFITSCTTAAMGNVDVHKYIEGKVYSLPHYNLNSQRSTHIDLRSKDLSELDIANRASDLYYADFDNVTKWPKGMPENYDPQKIYETGKNPGLGVRELQEEGITGKNIGIAIIDKTLLKDHVEYKDNLKVYEESKLSDLNPNMHGSAVASIAVGKSVGVAPGADLYYMAVGTLGYNPDTHDNEKDLRDTAKAIYKIIDINKGLPKDKKIRVISISNGADSETMGRKEFLEAIEAAKMENIFVVSTSLTETYGFKFNGLGREVLANPEEAAAYKPGLFWEKFYLDNYKRLRDRDKDMLQIPMDSRTVAGEKFSEHYVFYRTGGYSWSVPYIAGLYALACQVNPDITPDMFWNIALRTGDVITFRENGRKYELRNIVNPIKLMEALKNTDF